MNCNSLDFVDELDYLANDGLKDEYDGDVNDDEESKNDDELQFIDYFLIEKNYGRNEGQAKLSIGENYGKL